MKLCDRFLEQLKVKFNKKTVANFLNTHSSHPSILSISDLLDEFSIDNAAVRINKQNFNQIEAPFIAKTQSSEGDFCLITKIEKENVIYINELNETVNETLEQFYLQYSGVVLVAETNSNSIEPNFLANKKKYFWQNFNTALLIVLMFILSFSAVALQNLSWQPVLLYFTKATGLATSVLLLIQSFDANNPFINKLCSSSASTGQIDHP
jgi:ABC-type bacteriocin/lantibiotic exporter with double-glycine peptidase domain